MIDVMHYHVDDMLINVSPASYLVIVQRTEGPSYLNQVRDLPDWVFTSKHVIWLTDEKLTVGERARNGEVVKRSLMNRRKQAS